MHFIENENLIFNVYNYFVFSKYTELQFAIDFLQKCSIWKFQ